MVLHFLIQMREHTALVTKHLRSMKVLKTGHIVLKVGRYSRNGGQYIRVPTSTAEKLFRHFRDFQGSFLRVFKDLIKRLLACKELLNSCR